MSKTIVLSDEAHTEAAANTQTPHPPAAPNVTLISDAVLALLEREAQHIVNETGYGTIALVFAGGTPSHLEVTRRIKL